MTPKYINLAGIIKWMFVDTYWRTAQLNQDITTKKAEITDHEQALKALGFEHCRLSTMTTKLKGELKKQLGELIRETYIGVAYQQRGLEHQAEDYYNRRAEQLDSDMSLDLQSLVHNIIHSGR